MPVPEKLKNLVAQMPDPDGRGMYTENIDKEKIERAVAEIHQGGGEFVAGLVDLLDEPGSVENVKPHYALHCLANHMLVVQDENGRRQLVEVLCQKLGSDDVATHNKRYLCELMQWSGRREACTALGQVLDHEDLVEPAAMALVAIRDGAAEQFRAALPKVEGFCRLNCVHGLAALKDSGSAALLREALGDAEADVRLAAGHGLALLADARDADPLLQAADRAEGWERIQQTQNCLILAEQLTASGKKADAAQIYTRLRDTRKDPAEQYIREAAEKALAAA